MFARAPWYPAHAAGARVWGVTLLGDQQLAGLIMWIPAGFIYIAAVALLFLKWMRTDERRTTATSGSERERTSTITHVTLREVSR